ncbi:ATP synthase subunit I [Desulforhopalus sp. IMCC35007]|uniref:ATP synthase subunit I n=1 Tax=Desulforhopalus sp. IMCC35007 TaxID=2569543 RepID=UPI0010AE97DE|nr:ATP synthase subunit I [Desulforhopalus sp. IMCC35007]TKB12175.1 ATP synthase subunit I [Desulforhopalus sp. IMCC35007]
MTEGSLSLEKMQVVGACILAVMILVAAMFVSLWFAWSVLVGGIISMCSFWIANKGILKLVETVTSLGSPEDQKAKSQQEQRGYLLKFWLRIIIIGIVLTVLIKGQMVNIFGLILGLSTVVLTVTLISVQVAWDYFFRGR